MDTYLILARIVYVLDLMVWLLPKLAIASAVMAAVWGIGKLKVYVIRR